MSKNDKQRAIERDRQVQGVALEILKSFGPIIAGSNGMDPVYFRNMAFKHAEEFVAEGERRVEAISESFNKPAVVVTPATPSGVATPAPTETSPATV